MAVLCFLKGTGSQMLTEKTLENFSNTTLKTMCFELGASLDDVSDEEVFLQPKECFVEPSERGIEGVYGSYNVDTEELVKQTELFRTSLDKFYHRLLALHKSNEHIATVFVGLRDISLQVFSREKAIAFLLKF